MNLKVRIPATQQQKSDLTLAERAQLSCDLAKQLEKAGDYEAACEALAEFWPHQDGMPKLEGLNEVTKAELMLRAGVLSGWLHSADQNGSHQEIAKDLITRSMEVLEILKATVKLSEARGELALCYWREGSYDEARIHLAEALSCLDDRDDELRAVLLIRAAIVEVDAQRFEQALRLYDEV